MPQTTPSPAPAGPRRLRLKHRDLVYGLFGLLTLVLALVGYVDNRDPYLRYLYDGERETALTVSLVAVAAVTLAARIPGLALALVWAVLLSVTVMGVPPQLALVMTASVGFACSAWGSRLTLWLSGLSVPLGIVVVFVALDPLVVSRLAGDWGAWDFAYNLYQTVDWRLIIGASTLLVLLAPWLAGLVVRFRNRSEAAVRETAVAEAERDHAEEVAQAREQQAQLARDVHDVVGHSLTVILAQAQAAQFHRDEAQVRQALDTIATTAQTSLEDVRRVLSATSGAPQHAPAVEELHAMLDAVRASGRRVEFVEEGQPRPLPPELATVAHRVVQEMLTNAVRHGAESEPILVERHWAWDLRLEVANAVADPAAAGPAEAHSSGLPVTSAGAAVDETQPIILGSDGTVLLDEPTRVRATPVDSHGVSAGVGGQGVLGMRRRLESIGGRLDVRRRSNPPTHTVTAWIPLPGTLEGNDFSRRGTTQ